MCNVEHLVQKITLQIFKIGSKMMDILFLILPNKKKRQKSIPAFLGGPWITPHVLSQRYIHNYNVFT